MTVFLALLLDAVMGEPKWLWSRIPHPAVLMGRLIGQLDARLNTGTNKRLKGAAAMGLLVALAWVLGAILSWVPGIWLDVIVGAILLAHRSLVDHVGAVQTALILSVEEGRSEVAKIVSRDTSTMDRSAVARSAIESGAENLSDGVIAPALWFLVAGLPGLLIYKITNTADSMIGYKTARHAEFGWAAARFDDLLNWIPARLTAGVIWLTDRQSSVWRIISDARLHRSPNAGWPEAAVAHKHQIALAGPRSYDGQLTEFPYVNPDGRKDIRPSDIGAVVRTLWQVWAITALFTLLYGIFTV